MENLTQKEKIIEDITHAIVNLYANSNDFERHYNTYAGDIHHDLQKADITYLKQTKNDLINKISNTLKK